MGTNYYARPNHCGGYGRYDQLHIGKSSAGWRFSFEAHPDHEPPLTSWAEWRDFLVEVPIFNEYGAPMPLPEFVALVETKMEADNCQACYMATASGPQICRDYHDPEGHPFYPGEFS